MNHRRVSNRPVAYGVFLVSALALLAGPAGCGRHEGPARAGADSRAPIAVRTVTVSGSEPGEGLIVSGRVAAREEVAVRATISGRVTTLPLREGGRFAKGAVLARFEAPETRASVAAVRAAERAARHRLDVAMRQEARLDSLHARRVAALRELELAQEERLAAEAAHEAAAAAREALLSGSEIRAPFAGVVVRRHVDPGATVAVGEAVLDIRSGGTGEIVAAVPEAWLPALESSRIEIRVGGGGWDAARLVRVEGMTDFRSRTREARFLPGPGHGPLEPGSYAEVRIARGAPPNAASPSAAAAGEGTVRAPAGALVRRGALTGVFVIRDGRAWLRWVRLGRSDGADVEVLAGLLPGETIAAEPSGLTDGRAVTVSP